MWQAYCRTLGWIYFYPLHTILYYFAFFFSVSLQSINYWNKYAINTCPNHSMFISMIHSVHLDLLGLPDGWLVVEEPLGNDSGNPGIKYRNYWTDDVTRMKTPPTAPAPLSCVYEHAKDTRKDAKKRKSISMHSVRQSEGSGDSINIAQTGVFSTQAAVSAHLVPKTSGKRCANCSIC